MQKVYLVILNYRLFHLLLIVLGMFACTESNKNISDLDDKSNESIVSLKSMVDSSSIVLIIERGAFHYDKFVLQDTIITFYPSEEKLSVENESYNRISQQAISRQGRNDLIDAIIGRGFFKLKDSYLSNTSCTSSLIITLEFSNQSKKVVSEDYERECPELLMYIEQKIVEMHNKNLKRILLPG